MTVCRWGVSSLGGAGSRLGPSEVTYADLVARGAYRAAVWVTETCRDWISHRRTMKALNELEKLDDRKLADLGITRDDLTVAALALAATKRNRAQATMGYQA